MPAILHSATSHRWTWQVATGSAAKASSAKVEVPQSSLLLGGIPLIMVNKWLLYG